MKRLTAILLVICMMFTMIPSMAYADIDLKDDLSSYEEGLCEHHPEHDESCGYEPSSEGDPCSHMEDGEHDDSCYELICGYEEGEIEEDRIATNTDASKPHRHDDSCYELFCPHMDGEHDEACGYVPAADGSPCAFACEICNAQGNASVAVATPSNALPVTALAMDDATIKINYGRTEGTSTTWSQNVLSGTESNPDYATTGEDGQISNGTENNYNIKWGGKTLTLRNATIMNAAGAYNEDENFAISYSGTDPLTIELIGTNRILKSGKDYVVSYGIHAGGDVTISGETGENGGAVINVVGEINQTPAVSGTCLFLHNGEGTVYGNVYMEDNNLTIGQ